MSLWFLLLCHALTQEWCGVASWHLSVNFTKAITKTHVYTKSLYIKTWFVCSNKFECLKTVETFQAPKRDSWCLPQIYQQLHVLNDLQNVALAIIIERQNKRNFSDQCQTKFLLPKSKWILRSSHDSFVQFCDRSVDKNNAKHMENGLIFHVTIQIQILTMFSVQSK